ncbi:MAG: DUF3990 domain-containing protein [Spirochaetales bacterium]|nr:DUF3990 domain-containing protein [Spirochaetales bacterium]
MGKGQRLRFCILSDPDQGSSGENGQTETEGGDKAVVSIFEWNEDKENLKYKLFPSPDLEWLDVIIRCRSDVDFRHGFDIVEGKIADDAVGETVLFVMDGIIKREDAVQRLSFQKINSQIAFCSEESLKTLRFVDSYEVR